MKSKAEVGAILGLGRIALYHWVVETAKRTTHVVAIGKSLEEAKKMAQEEVITGMKLGEAAHALTRLEGPPNKIVYEMGGLVLP